MLGPVIALEDENTEAMVLVGEGVYIPKEIHEFLERYYCIRSRCTNCFYRGVTFFKKGEDADFCDMACRKCFTSCLEIDRD